MIAEDYTKSDFKGDTIYAPGITALMAAAALPTLLAVATLGDLVQLWIDSQAPLGPAQRAQLDAIVSSVDGDAEELAAAKLMLHVAVDVHAKTLNQSAEKTKTEVDTTRDNTKKAIDATKTIDGATAVAVAYTGQQIA